MVQGCKNKIEPSSATELKQRLDSGNQSPNLDLRNKGKRKMRRGGRKMIKYRDGTMIDAVGNDGDFKI